MNSTARRSVVILAVCAGALAAPAFAQPVVVECQWKLVRSIAFDNPWSVAYNPLDDAAYVVRRSSSSDGLYRIMPDGVVTKVVGASRPGGLGIDPLDGDVFIAEDYGGVIYRVVLGASERTTWVSGFRGGDDDPVGIIIVPDTYTGSVVPPGTALSCDRGASGGYDDIWMWSPDVAEGELQLHLDDGTLVDAVDIAANDERLIVVDDRGDPGALWEIIDDTGALAEIVTSPGIVHPVSAVFDPVDGDLLVASFSTPAKIVRVRFTEGVSDVTDVIVGFDRLGWGSIDIRPNGQVLWATDYNDGLVYEFVRIGPCPPDFNHDCYVNTLDVLAFLNAWTIQDPAADFNGDGTVNTLDVLAFLNAWNAGC